MSEVYEQWRPHGKIPDSVYIQSIHDDSSGLEIVLGDSFAGNKTEKFSHVLFESPVGYRNFDEGDQPGCSSQCAVVGQLDPG